MSTVQRVITFIVFTIICQHLSAQYNLNLSGTINQAEKKITVRLSTYSMDSVSAIARDSTIVDMIAVPLNGQFTFKGRLKNRYEFVTLTVLQNEKYVNSWDFFISDTPADIKILSLATKIEAEIELKNIPFVKEIKDYNNAVNGHHEELLRARLGTSQARGKEKDSLLNNKRLAEKRLMLSRIKYITSNPGSYYSMYVFDRDIIRSIQGINLSVDSLMTIFHKFGNQLRNSELGQHIYTNIKKREGLSIGHKLPEFSFIDNNNQLHTLSGITENKYTLLCFWASYCGPCIRSMPILKKIDSMYKSKGLQMMSVSTDKSVSIWQKSLRKYMMHWPQSIDAPPYIKSSQKLQDRFGLTYIPQYFLIDENRTVLYQNVRSSDTDDFNVLYGLLGKIFK